MSEVNIRCHLEAAKKNLARVESVKAQSETRIAELEQIIHDAQMEIGERQAGFLGIKCTITEYREKIAGYQRLLIEAAAEDCGVAKDEYELTLRIDPQRR